MVDVFISYPRASRAKVEPIKAKLDAKGLDCFYDLEGIDGGAEFPAVIDRAVKAARAVLGCWSPSAFTRPWVMQECRVARARNILVPVVIEPFDSLAVPTEFFGLNYLDLAGWDGADAHEGWQRTLAALGRLVGQDLAYTPSRKHPTNAKNVNTAPFGSQTPPEMLADLRTTWAAFPAKDNQTAVAKFLDRVRAAAPGSGLEFEVEYNLDEMARSGRVRRAVEAQESRSALILGRWQGEIRFQKGQIQNPILRTWHLWPDGSFVSSNSDGFSEHGAWTFEGNEVVLREPDGTIYRGNATRELLQGSAHSERGMQGHFRMRKVAHSTDGVD